MPESGTRTPDLLVCSPTPRPHRSSQPPSVPLVRLGGGGSGRRRSDERGPEFSDQTRGVERGGGRIGGEMCWGGVGVGGGAQDFKNNNNYSKKTNNAGGKNTGERKERGAKEAQRHPRSSN